MSDTQRDREERQHVIEVLKSWDGYFIGYTSDEVQEALKYAIASIKTDLKYDLMYEGALEQEPCENCIFKKEWEKIGKLLSVILAKHTKQEPRKGHWIVHPKNIYAHLVCDKCLSGAPYDCETNFCPNCGADMRGK